MVAGESPLHVSRPAARSWLDEFYGLYDHLPAPIDWWHHIRVGLLAASAGIALIVGTYLGTSVFAGSASTQLYGREAVAPGTHDGCALDVYGVYGDGRVLAGTDCGWVILPAADRPWVQQGWSYTIDVARDGAGRIVRVDSVSRDRGAR